MLHHAGTLGQDRSDETGDGGNRQRPLSVSCATNGVAGSHVAWAKFDGYIPRREPVSGIAGGRTPGVDRVEWSIIADSATALGALQQGEQDYWDTPTADLIPSMRGMPQLVVEARNTSGSYNIAAIQPSAAALQRPGHPPGRRDGCRPGRASCRPPSAGGDDAPLRQLLRLRHAIRHGHGRRHPEDPQRGKGQDRPAGRRLQRRKGRHPGGDGLARDLRNEPGGGRHAAPDWA